MVWLILYNTYNYGAFCIYVLVEHRRRVGKTSVGKRITFQHYGTRQRMMNRSSK